MRVVDPCSQSFRPHSRRRRIRMESFPDEVRLVHEWEECVRDRPAISWEPAFCVSIEGVIAWKSQELRQLRACISTDRSFFTPGRCSVVASHACQNKAPSIVRTFRPGHASPGYGASEPGRARPLPSKTSGRPGLDGYIGHSGKLNPNTFPLHAFFIDYSQTNPVPSWLKYPLRAIPPSSP